MLGAASLLASRPDAFLAFLFRAGLGPAVRLFAQDDGTMRRTLVWECWPLIHRCRPNYDWAHLSHG
jgi:hypothetical protein